MPALHCALPAIGLLAAALLTSITASPSMAAGCPVKSSPDRDFISHNDSRFHFGLADNVSYDRIEVQWPGEGREVFPGGKSNRIVRLVQGSHGGN